MPTGSRRSEIVFGLTATNNFGMHRPFPVADFFSLQVGLFGFIWVYFTNFPGSFRRGTRARSLRQKPPFRRQPDQAPPRARTFVLPAHGPRFRFHLHAHHYKREPWTLTVHGLKCLKVYFIDHQRLAKISFFSPIKI
jgi:hypothetical protein